MARSRLSIHAIPHHDPDAVIHYASQLQPPVILIVNPDPDFISRCYRASPGSIFSLRNHALSEQKQDVYDDPAGTGNRHAREMVEWCDKIFADAAERDLPMPSLNDVILPGVNEPLVNTDEEITAVVTYNVHYLDGLTARGRRGSALEFSVGWPRNTGEDRPPEWKAFLPVYQAIRRGGHIASMHEYWPHEGPSTWAGWLCYRLVRWIPDYWANVPFIITECGLDDAAMPGRAHAFWKDFFTQNPQGYVNQYYEYEWNCRTITNQNGVQINILGYCMFTSDYGGSEWENADIKQIVALFIHLVNTANLPDFPVGHTVHLPAIGAGIPIGSSPKPEPVTPLPPVLPPTKPGDLASWTVTAMCRIFDYDPIIVQAILNVESGNRPFQDGRPIIRNELHIGYNRTDNKEKWKQHFRWDENEQWKNQQYRLSEDQEWQYVHQNQASEWRVFELAKSIDPRAAHFGLGMGAAQMMGFNYRIPNYASPEAMLDSFSDPEQGAANQIAAMFAYFYQVDGLPEAIRNKDLPTIARLYNGSGQVDYYVQQFKKEIDKLQ